MPDLAVAPLEDPSYQPEHPPIGGLPPDIVAKWGHRSQLRWFARFKDRLSLAPAQFWAKFHCASQHHTGQCCISCAGDWWDGYGMDLDGKCCCYGLAEEAASDG